MAFKFSLSITHPLNLNSTKFDKSLNKFRIKCKFPIFNGFILWNITTFMSSAYFWTLVSTKSKHVILSIIFLSIKSSSFRLFNLSIHFHHFTSSSILSLTWEYLYSLFNIAIFFSIMLRLFSSSFVISGLSSISCLSKYFWYKFVSWTS